MAGPERERALILRTIKLGDSSKIVSALGERYGRIKLVAKGSRRVGSRLGALLEPGNELELLVYAHPDRDLWMLGDAALERAALTGGGSLDKLSYLLAALELADRLLPEREPLPSIASLFGRHLELWHQSDDAAMAPLFFALEFALADELGIALGVTECGSCGKDLAEGGRASYRATEGTLQCGSCAIGGGRWLDAEELDSLAALQDLHHGATVPQLSEEKRKVIGRLLHEHLSFHLHGYRIPRALFWLVPREDQSPENPGGGAR